MDKISRPKVLIDADVLIAYLIDDTLANHSAIIINQAINNQLELIGSPELYMDIITAYKSQGTSDSKIRGLLVDLAVIPHRCVRSTLDLATSALKYYSQYGGSRKLHFFDAFHVAAARKYELPLITSDAFILKHDHMLNIKTVDLRSIE